MIGVLDMGPRVLAYSINGRIEKADIERVVADMDAKVPMAEKVRLYVEVNHPDGMTPEALFRDLQLGVPRTQYLLRIERVAIVSDSNAIRAFAAAQSKIARWFETRIFEGHEKLDAATWVQAP
jgi:hypothetical protein